MQHPSKWHRLLGVLLFVTICWLNSAGFSRAQIERQFTHRVTDSPSFNIYTGHGHPNDPIVWEHVVPAEALTGGVRAGIYIEAWDVDYPAEDEHDRVFINGHDVGLLEGRNDSWQTNEIRFPVAYLNEGPNRIEVAVDELNAGWQVTIRASELYVYRSEAPPAEPEPEAEPEERIELSLDKKQSTAKILPGDQQIYDILVTNQGNVAVHDITIRDTLDPALEYISDTSGITPVVEDQTYSWYLNRSLDPGEQFRFKITTRVSPELRAGRTVSNTAQLESPDLDEPVWSDPVRANSGYIWVPPDGLEVSKRVVPKQARIGKILTYRVAIANIARGPVFDVVLEDRLPQGVELVPGKVLRDGRPFADPAGRQTLRWPIGTLLPGASTVITYQVIVGTDAKRGQKINTAKANGVDGGGNGVSGQAQALFLLGRADVEELGAIRVRVFHDRNDDGFFNGPDDPVPGIGIILTAGGIKLTTDPHGVVFFDGIKPDYHLVALDERTLPAWAQLSRTATTMVTLMEGETGEVWFPLMARTGARLEGRLFLDRNRDNQRQEDEAQLPAFTVTLDDQIQTKGRNGRFVFKGLDPGGHTLTISAGGRELTRTIELYSGSNTIDIPWRTGGIRIDVKEGQ